MTRSPLFSRCLSPWAWTLLIPLLFLPLFSQEQQKVLEDFSSSKAGSSPNGWSPRDDRGAPYYKVLEKDGNRYMRANVVSDSVPFYKKVKWEIQKYPRLSWRWRIIKFPPLGNEQIPEQNDTAGAVYATWINIWKMEAKSVKYIWSLSLPKGTEFKKKTTWFIVVRSGKKEAGLWVPESVDVLADYKRLWGDDSKNPNLLVVLSDSNATKSRVICDYEDFVVSSR